MKKITILENSIPQKPAAAINQKIATMELIDKIALIRQIIFELKHYQNM